MQTLTFNTKNKRIILVDGPRGNSKVLESFEDITTVKPTNGYYEIMQRVQNESSPTGFSAVPIMRVPISNTNMVIVS